MIFSVYYYTAIFPEIAECEVKHVPMTEAVEKFKFLTNNVAAKVGLTHRVLITDGGDLVVAEWIFGRGIVWPRNNEGA